MAIRDGLHAASGYRRGEPVTVKVRTKPAALRIAEPGQPPYRSDRGSQVGSHHRPTRGHTELAAPFDSGDSAVEEIEDLFADSVRLATETGDLPAAQDLAGHAAALAAGSEIPHRQANALYCRGLLDHDGQQLLAAVERYGDASRPLLRAKPLETAAREFVRADDPDQARAAFTRATEIYTWLGAAVDAARLRAGPIPPPLWMGGIRLYAEQRDDISGVPSAPHEMSG